MSDVEEVGEGGEGAEIYPYGEYEGGRDENLDRHGWGSALLPNGDIYEGNYRRGLRMGKGLYCFRNGARYDGDWRKGKKHGIGTFVYPDGTTYTGQWRKDLKHGHGTYHYANGDTYEGNWFRNFRHGLGTYSYNDVNVTFYGTWKNGRMEGPGVLKYPGYRYHGKFEQNLPKGPGCFTFENVWMQHGFYLNIRDPAFDYVGAEDLTLDDTEETTESEYRGNPRGIVPIWRARSVAAFKSELLPPSPVPLPYKDSEDSLISIMEYLEQQYTIATGENETDGYVDENDL
ncbi:hypothetical protein PPYR_06666 [Photinus pyralis]|nr:radial spoke head 1 homolog isoform X1 [Photinus pyralis]KAB0798786.1 hypothetical protein PPYR_06666 [Photinus pyralis]